MATFPLALRNLELDAHYHAITAKLERETQPPTQTRVLSRLGDEQQLRGIPAIGRGVRGAITGTTPESVTNPC